MGYVGKQYVEEIFQTKYCNVLFCVDKKYADIKFPGVNISSPECIRNYQKEKIVIAQSNDSVAAEIYEELLSWGIEKKRIIHKTSFIILEDNLVAKLDRIWNSVESLNGLRDISMSIESELRDWRTINNSIINKYELAHYKRIHQLMNVKMVEGASFTRVGNKHDGGYILLKSSLDDKNPLMAYSFGINDDVSWDKHMASLGYDVFMYDHTIQLLPEENDKFHFFKLGITDGSPNKNLKTLEQLIKINQHENLKGMILKMDVEGAEYGFLKTVECATLEQFDQIILELHSLTNMDMTESIISALEKINKTHQLIHIHANNYCRIRYIKGNIMPDTLETLYVLKEKYKFKEMQNEDYEKNNIDAPCWNERLEINMKNWNYYVF